VDQITAKRRVLYRPVAMGTSMPRYIFFPEHVLVLASHMPPAFWQSTWVFAVVTSPANTGPVRPIARAKVRIKMNVFIGVSSFTLLLKENAPCRDFVLPQRQSVKKRPRRATGRWCDQRLERASTGILLAKFTRAKD
jgi:hypothetical protein